MKMLVGLALAAATIAPFAKPAPASETRVEKTTWDSVYTDAQAAHGDSLYKTGCAKCHGATLTGADDGGPLVGKEFLGSWNGMTLDQLSNKIYTTMPSDMPKSIPQKDVADLVAFILAQNKFPAGAAPLPGNQEQQKDIRIVTSR